MLQTAMPELMKGLGVKWPGQAMMKWQQFARWGMHNVEYGSTSHKALSITKPLLVTGLVLAGLAGVTALIVDKLASKRQHWWNGRRSHPWWRK